MKRIDTDHSWNWVDENNRMVGFDNEGQCCGEFGYKFIDKLGTDLDLDDRLKRFNFTGQWGNAPDSNVDYFPRGEIYEANDPNIESFEMINGKRAKVWLIIWNSHNGYYSHGFFFSHNDDILFRGEL